MARTKETPESGTEEARTERPQSEKPSYCLLCGQAGSVVLYGHWICDHCKNVVQAEALEKKRQIIKDRGGPPSGL